MGSDPALFMAYLFLYYENKWVNKVKKVDLNRARRFANFFRFIDDITTTNDGGRLSSERFV